MIKLSQFTIKGTRDNQLINDNKSHPNNKRTDNIKTYIIGPPPPEIISIGYLVCNEQSLGEGSYLVVLGIVAGNCLLQLDSRQKIHKVVFTKYVFTGVRSRVQACIVAALCSVIDTGII